MAKKKNNLNETNWNRHLSSCKKVNFKNTSKDILSYFSQKRKSEFPVDEVIPKKSKLYTY